MGMNPQAELVGGPMDGWGAEIEDTGDGEPTLVLVFHNVDMVALNTAMQDADGDDEIPASITPVTQYLRRKDISEDGVWRYQFVPPPQKIISPDTSGL